ncbi:hypothetical protein J6590_037494 [Homalodisca vitripennis]|nr:hypothetical protein J6590_037494 [Homalodisca vitripennis]
MSVRSVRKFAVPGKRYVSALRVYSHAYSKRNLAAGYRNMRFCTQDPLLLINYLAAQVAPGPWVARYDTGQQNEVDSGIIGCSINHVIDLEPARITVSRSRAGSLIYGAWRRDCLLHCSPLSLREYESLHVLYV